MKRCFIISIMLAASIGVLLVSCSNVTETGNPCPSGGCPPTMAPSPSENPEEDSGGIYSNDAYGVTIICPFGWTYEESADGSSVSFESPDTPPTTALITFERLEESPESLFGVVYEQCSGCNLIHYSTMTLTGYLYDDPAPGENGGDLREYYFLNEDVLITVGAEVFSSGRVGLGTLLNGISFKGGQP